MVDYYNYSKVILLRNASNPNSVIIKKFERKYRIKHWIYSGCKPFIIELFYHFINLDNPGSNLQWISINSTRGGKFIGPWIKVPKKVKNYIDIKNVMIQLLKINNINEINSNIEEKFAYLLGFIGGDASKFGIKRKNRITRRIHIRLTKLHITNKNLGDYISNCMKLFGINMNRRKDCPAGKRNPHPFYTWISQSSMIFQWLYDVCLGLKNNELTTYHPIRADWILKSPKYFKIAFIQGLGDSDGFNDFSAIQTGILTGPNTELVKKIFDYLNVHSCKRYFQQSNLWSLMISIDDAYRLPVFNPEVKFYRYVQLEKLYKAERISGHWPTWLKEKVKKYYLKGLKGTELVKKLLDEDKIIIRQKGIKNVIKKLKK
ncbi:hypothetical protein ACFL1H_01925 [Nanoarchaeota archaeon]